MIHRRGFFAGLLALLMAPRMAQSYDAAGVEFLPGAM